MTSIRPSSFVQFKPSATSKKHCPALEEQTVSKVFGLERNIEVFPGPRETVKDADISCSS